jgi:hypothetical protein
VHHLVHVQSDIPELMIQQVMEEIPSYCKTMEIDQVVCLLLNDKYILRM